MNLFLLCVSFTLNLVQVVIFVFSSSSATMIDESFVISRAHLFPCMPHTKHSWKAVRPKSKANETDAVSGKNHIRVGILGLSIEIERSSKPTIHGGVFYLSFVLSGPPPSTRLFAETRGRALSPLRAPPRLARCRRHRRLFRITFSREEPRRPSIADRDD